MRIALTADPELPVPPRLYGGIERIIDMLARELVRQGHEVTLFAHPDSDTAGTLVPWPGRSSASKTDTLRNAATLARHVIGGGFDVVHSFSRIAYLTPILPLPAPKLMTYQREITRRTVEQGHSLSRGTLAFSAISDWMMQDVKDVGRWFMVPNGVPLDTYRLTETVAADAPLIFLGRLEEIKGPHLAIDIAKASGRKLILAGNIPAEHQAWYDAMVAPRVDGDQIRYVGPVDDVQKNQILGEAAAFLMPILWEEPFGIVMAEALACGAPVLGLRRGAVPEVVEDGVTGFVTDTVDELTPCVGRLGEISRAACRRRVERLYSAEAVTAGYLQVYQTLARAAEAMRAVLSYPGVMDHAQQAALSLREAGRLSAFATAFAFRAGGGLDQLLNIAPKSLADRARRQLERRAVLPDLTGHLVSFPFGEVVRTVAAKAGFSPEAVDRVWDRSARGFDQAVARRLVPACDLIAAFEYTALASFERAKAEGKASLLHMPSLDSLAFKRLQDREREVWPELKHASDGYFEGRFAERYERRQREVALADLIIANSSLTKRSHVEAGADGAKIQVVPLAAPPAIAEAIASADGPLKVMWSGAFSLRKGAHYLLDAWRGLNPGVHAGLRVYGQVVAPSALMATAPDDIHFLGSTPRATVLDAYAEADVLVFPSLSDGFGQSVTEALSRGVPVIVTDQVGAADLIESGVNGLIVPAGDAHALTQALQWCLDNRAVLRDMRPKALATAQRHQWSDYRRALNAATEAGLRQSGFAALVA